MEISDIVDVCPSVMSVRDQASKRCKHDAFRKENDLWVHIYTKLDIGVRHVPEPRSRSGSTHM
jgi:hypothetical protein